MAPIGSSAMVFAIRHRKKLNGFGIFGYFVLIMLGVWLATTVFNRFF
jgi:hypothetical protein